MNILLESCIFGIILVVFGFIISYITDFAQSKKIDWLPSHSSSMASGIFFTGVVVYLLFSKKYLQMKYKNYERYNVSKL